VKHAFSDVGIRSGLIQETPFEAFAIIWVKIPLLITAFLAYPWILFWGWRSLAPRWEEGKRRWLTTFFGSSGCLFLLTGAVGFLAWEHGAAATLLGIGPDIQKTYTVTLSRCFNLFAGVTMGIAVLLQIPVVAFFWQRFGGLR
jgi:Sec-independent protein secretion pathway component TatC